MIKESPYTEDLIALVQLSTEVSRPPCQDEGDKDALAVLSSHNVEPQARRTSMDQNSSRLPLDTSEENQSQYKAESKGNVSLVISVYLGISSSPIMPCSTGEKRLGEVGVRACG